MTKQQKLKLIFRPGFSTADQVSDLSGRGVGMDVVRDTVEKLKGSVDIQTSIGQETKITIRLPITLAILKILLFKVGADTLSIPLYNVQETVKISHSEIYESNNRLVTNLRGMIIPLIYLNELLGIPLSKPHAPGEKVSIIIVEVIERIYGLVVSEFLGKTDIIIKNLGALLRKVHFISGGAILGGGEVVLVLDPLEIIQGASEYASSTRLMIAESAAETQEPDETYQRKRVLVVEDNKTMATFLGDFLRNGGFDVDIAENGITALEKLKSSGFEYDVISTDIIMPHMDGYEFTRKIREMPRYETVPVIALTAKGKKFDKVKGFKAGIDEYLVKPVVEDVYMSLINHYAYRQ